MLRRPPLRVAINAQLPRGAAGGTEQNLVRLVHSLLSVSRATAYTLVGPGRHSEWLGALVRGGHRVLPGFWAGEAPPPPPGGALGRVWRALRPRWPRRRLPADNGDLLRRAGAQVVHFPYQAHFPVDAPFLYEPWDLQHLHLPEFFTPEEVRRREQVYRDGCERAALVVTATQWTRQDLVARYGIPAEKIAVIPRGAFVSGQPRLTRAEAGRILAPLGLPEDFLFFPAKDFLHKNHSRLFEALAGLRRRGVDARLVCCGRVLDRNRELWGGRLAELGLTDHVRLLGRVEDEVVAALFARARALAFPSLFEGLGIPILEAFQVGLPVVTTRASCIPEVAGDAAVYADGLSAESLADALAVVYTQPETVERCRRLGLERVRRYDWRQAGRDFLACYRCVAGVAVTGEDERLFRRVTGAA